MTMSIRILNSASMSPWFPRWHIGGVVLLVDTDQGSVLVDTGLGLHDHLAPSRLVKFFIADFGIHKAPDETAIRRVSSLGIKPESIKHIVLTHMHFDHAGGLPDFPWASVHAHRAAVDTLSSSHNFFEVGAYDRKDFAHSPHWVLYNHPTEKWFDFDAIRLPFSPSMFLIPLFGHTRGHCGVAIQDGSRWHLHCADAIPTSADFKITPMWLNHLVLGVHVERLRDFAQSHPEVTITAGHMWLSSFN